jgi:hypothetical protein
VTAAKIADATITKAKMAALSVGTAQVEDAAITVAKVANGATVQRASTQTGAMTTGTTLIPIDDTIPQITEGFEVMTLAFTPLLATSILRIETTCVVSHPTDAATIVSALFQDATANALAAVCMSQSATGGTVTLRMTHNVTAASTTARTYRVRIGSGTAGTVTFNGAGGARLFGGVMASSIVITEFKA